MDETQHKSLPFPLILRQRGRIEAMGLALQAYPGLTLEFPAAGVSSSTCVQRENEKSPMSDRSEESMNCPLGCRVHDGQSPSLCT